MLVRLKYLVALFLRKITLIKKFMRTPL